MKNTITVEVEYLDGEIVVPEEEPAKLKDLVILLGEDFVRTLAIDNTRYRNKNPRVYKKISTEIQPNFPRAIKREEKRKDGTTRRVLESHIDHIRRFYQQSKTECHAIFEKIAPEEPIYVKGERTGTGRISAKAIESANIFIAQGEEVAEEKVAFIEMLVPNYRVERDTDGSVTVEGLARGIQALNRFLEKQAKEKAKSMGMSV